MWATRSGSPRWRGAATSSPCAGIFDLGNRDVNQRWVLVSLRAGQTLLDLAGGVTSIEVRVADAFAAERIAGEIATVTL